MLRLAIARNIPFLAKTLTKNVDKTVLVSHSTNYLKQLSNVKNGRHFSLTNARFGESNEEKAVEEEEDDKNIHPLFKKYAGTPRDRSKIIPVETSIEYIESAAFKSTYGDKKVWELYRRVHKGQLPKKVTRKTCIRGNVIAVGSPCPICRDEYLVLDYRNLGLLKMFVSPHTGEVCHSNTIITLIHHFFLDVLEIKC